MERTLILFFATLMVFVTSGVHAQLSYATNATVNITRTGCASTKLCVQTPDACDPTGSSNCLFGSALVRNATTNEFAFQLSGNSSGYIALGLNLSPTTGSTMLFICAPNLANNMSFNFFTRLSNNTLTSNGTAANLTSFNTTVTQIRGVVNNTKIQCEFNVPNLNASASASVLRTLDTTFGFSLGSGPLNPDGTPGAFTVRLGTNLLDLSNPLANVANTTAAPNTTATTSGSNRALHSEGVLLLMGVLSLGFLTTA